MKGKLRCRLTILVAAPSAMLAQHSSGQINNVSSFGLSAVVTPALPRPVGLSPDSIALSPRSIGLSPASIGLSPESLSFRGKSRAEAEVGPGKRGDRGLYPYGLGGMPIFAATGAEGDVESADDAAAGAEGSNSVPDTGVALSNQLRRLTQQVRDLQDQIAHMAIRPPEIRPSPPEEAEPAAAPAITVVLKSGKTFQTQDYAVIGDTFWDLSSDPARKFSVATIDLAASKRASQADGALFPVLSAER